jgi:transcriptional regulator of acetoin/glycerol metabolism
MLSAAAQPRVLTDGDRLAVARERFLTGKRVAAGEVREMILASWWRCRQWNLAAGRIELPYAGDPHLDTPLTRSALPVLLNLRELLEGQPISVILTDAAGVALTRLAADHDLERHLDRIQLAPGFSYAEQYAGTNGIGTALESGQSAHVFGCEHYAEDLEDLACAAAPIHDPVSGKTLGAAGLTCWRKDAGPLLITLARTTVGQITQALLTSRDAREVELLREYRRACRHSGGMVLALSHDVVMLNEYARQVLDPGDQAALLGQAAETLASRRAAAVMVELPTGTRARMTCRPLRGQDRAADGVVHVKLIEPGTRPAAGTGPQARMILPGLAGSGPLWLRGCHQVASACDSAGWLAVQGEPGVGKLALVRAVYRRRNPAGRFHVLDAAGAAGQDWLVAARRELLDGQGCLVIRHIDRLSPRRLHGLLAALQETQAAGRQHTLWVAVTLGQGPASGDLAELLRLFPSTVDLPPLRHHIEDLRDLVPFFLAKLSHDPSLACSPGAMQILLRSSWPGNTGQLWQVIRKVVQHRRSGAIQPGDLPAECWTVSRRLLHPLESMERDAIVQGLLDYKGNKAKAAKSLGMSRATIYRKIHQYGIVTPAS